MENIYYRMKLNFFLVVLVCLLFSGFNLLHAQKKLNVEVAFKELNDYVNVRDVAVSSDQKEVYFTIQSAFNEIAQIAYMTHSEGKWSSPELMDFSGRYSDLEPFLSPDQKTLYFASNRPLDGTSTEVKDYDIWCVKRSDIASPWGQPINLGHPVNTKNDEFYPSTSINNNLYYTMDAASGMGKDDIYFSAYKDGTYSAPQLLDSNVNSDGFEFNAFISRNEDFILFTKYNSEGGIGSGDLYISRREAGGNWARSENLGTIINTTFMEYCPFYDQDNEILYFTSRRNTIKAQKFASAKDLTSYLMEGENGLSKIYKVKIKLHN